MVDIQKYVFQTHFFRNRSSLLCDGHGRCNCGKCECESISSDPEKKYSGEFCEYNNYKCGYSDGKICGGNYVFV